MYWCRRQLHRRRHQRDDDGGRIDFSSIALGLGRMAYAHTDHEKTGCFYCGCNGYSGCCVFQLLLRLFVCLKKPFVCLLKILSSAFKKSFHLPFVFSSKFFLPVVFTLCYFLYICENFCPLCQTIKSRNYENWCSKRNQEQREPRWHDPCWSGRTGAAWP